MKASQQVQWGSIAVSLDRLSFLDRLYVSAALAGVLIWTFPHVGLASTMKAQPLVFEIKNISLQQIQEDYLAKVLAPDIPVLEPDPRVELLRQYLQSKRSVLANEAGVLLQQYHYRLILGIAFAESNFCKIQIAANNCWGIGGSRPVAYASLTAGIVRANEIIQKYQDLGMTTPKYMRNSWVGWPNDNWIIAVEQITMELESRGL